MTTAETSLTPGARRILASASSLFYDGGIHAVGVDTIAAESGVTKRTLYNRFGSKDALVAAYLRDRHESWWAGLQQRLAAAPRPRALAVFDAYVDSPLRSDRGCAFLNSAGELSADHPGFTVITAHKDAVRTLVAELVREDRADSEDSEDSEDSASVAEHLFLLLEGGIAHRGIDGDDHLLRRARAIAEALLER